MNETKRGSLMAGIGLVLLGALFICIDLIPGISLAKAWPLIFFVISFAFFLPGLAWPDSRKGLAALYIPGTIFFVLGAIFLFNMLTANWVIWAFAWILIPASVGLGLVGPSRLYRRSARFPVRWHDAAPTSDAIPQQSLGILCYSSS